MSDLIRYSEFEQRHQAAIAAFRTIYESQNPLPEKAAVEKDSVFVPVALVLMIAASVIVSGSRTIVEFGGGLIGFSAFVMLEIGIVAYAFFRTRRNFNEDKVNGVRKLATFGLALAFAVAVAANVHAVLKEKGVALADWLNTGILVMVSISAPTLALISGDVLALESMANTVKTRKAEREYQAAMAEWRKQFNGSWNAQKSRWGVRVEALSDEDSNGIQRNSIGMNGMESREIVPSASTLGHSKQPQASKIVRDYLAEHPEAADMNPIELAAMLNVGKSTAYKIVGEYKANRE